MISQTQLKEGGVDCGKKGKEGEREERGGEKEGRVEEGLGWREGTDRPRDVGVGVGNRWRDKRNRSE